MRGGRRAGRSKLDLNQLAGEGNRGWGVLLLAHGAPERLEDIPDFLLNVRGGRPLPEAAVQEIARRYEQIGGCSPLLKLTHRQAKALERELNGSGSANELARVYVGMRNWKPYISDAVRQLGVDRIKRVTALCLAPQNSRTSIGLYRTHLRDAVEKNASTLRFEFIESWHDHPGLIAAFREKVGEALSRSEAEAGGPVPVIFSAHSVPEKTIEQGDPYERQVRETASRVAEALGLNDHRVAFQSQGMTPEPWIGPTVESQIDRLAEEGHRRVLIAPVGFVSDHVEVLYDIDIVFREYGKAQGVTVTRSESLNDSPLLIRALASIVSARREQQAEGEGSKSEV